VTLTEMDKPHWESVLYLVYFAKGKRESPAALIVHRSKKKENTLLGGKRCLLSASFAWKISMAKSTSRERGGKGKKTTRRPSSRGKSLRFATCRHSRRGDPRVEGRKGGGEKPTRWRSRSWLLGEDSLTRGNRRPQHKTEGKSFTTEFKTVIPGGRGPINFRETGRGRGERRRYTGKVDF